MRHITETRRVSGTPILLAFVVGVD